MPDDAVRRTCFKCGETKPLSEFYKHPLGKYGRDTKCKACAQAYAQSRRDDAALREKMREYDRVRRKTDEDRAKENARRKAARERKRAAKNAEQ